VLALGGALLARGERPEARLVDHVAAVFGPGDEVGTRRRPIAHDGDRTGGGRDTGGQKVVAHERVDERALALLDLAEHRHAHTVLREAATRVVLDRFGELDEAELGGDVGELRRLGAQRVVDLRGFHSSPSLRVRR
jgi:hypothetical protein